VTVVERGVEAPSRAPGEGWLRRLWHAPLAAHVAVLAVALVALLPVMTPRGSFTSDEGAYALQARALQHGRWAYDYRAAPYDPGGRHFPIILSDRNGETYFSYVKHPLFPLLLSASSRELGESGGLHALSLLGVVGTAIAAWLLARELDPALSRPAFWLVAAGPVLVDGYLIWAHALSAAIGGLCLVAAVRLLRAGGWWRAAALGIGLAAGALLRSEGLLFAAAVTLAVAGSLLWQHLVRAAVLTAAVVGGPAAVATVVERLWIRSIVGAAPAPIAVRSSGSTSYLGGRVGGAWHELFQAGFADRLGLTLGLLGLAVTVGVAVLALQRRRETWPAELTVGLATGVGLLVVRFATAPTDAITGLFAAWPVALIGLVCVPWRSDRARPGVVRLLGAVCALFAAAVLATQYPEGGGFEWGGRFFSPVLAPIAVLAVFGLRTRLRTMPGGDRAAALATRALAAAVAVTAILGLATIAVTRGRQDALVAAVARHPATVTVTTIDALPRIGWRVDDRVTWMLTTAGELPGLVADLRAAGVPSVAVVSGAATPTGAALAAYPRVEVVHDRAVDRLHGRLVVLSG
jgi:hypothetical protein